MARRYPVQLVLIASVTAALLAVLPNASWGNVYPTSLGQSASTFNPSAAETVALSYLLNEDATNVSVAVLNDSNTVVRTITPGAQLKGAQSVIWDGTDDSAATLPDGNYSFRVTTTGASRATWTQISTDSPLNSFFVPRGVAVNNNPTSPYYGRVYVAESRGNSLPTVAPVRGVATTDGVYMLNADMTEPGAPGSTGPYTGGITWRSSTTTPIDGTTNPASPFRLQVGPDSSVYITDWSDANSGIYQAPGDLSGTYVEVLDSTGRLASGLNATHGSISDAIIVGTGASRTIYTIDEDFDPVPGTTSTGSVMRYDIGNTTTFTGAPSGIFYADGAGTDTQVNRIQNHIDSIAFDEDGNMWVNQFRSPTPSAADTLSPLLQIDPSGAVIWASTNPNGGGLATTTLGDPLRGTQGIAYDPVNNLLALATQQTGGTVILFDPISKTIITQFNFGNANNTDIAFDNVGNLYVNNRSGERLRVWSPPSAPTLGYVANEFSTESLAPLGAISISSVPPGLLGDHNGDGVVDAADYAAWAKDPAAFDGPQGYIDWASNFGATLGSGGGDGSSQVPEPATLALVMIPLLLAAGCRRRG